MENQTFNLLDYYKQSKQRADIEIDFKNKKILGKTNLTFLLKEEMGLSKHPENIILKLNSDNMIIKSANILLYNKNNNLISNENLNNINKDNIYPNNNSFISVANPNLIQDIKKHSDNENYLNPSGNNENRIIKNLKFGYVNPDNYVEYLKSLYHCVEDSESIKNLNRIEWENKIDGSLILEIPYLFLIESSLISMSDDQNGDKCVNKMQEKIKIIIEYELYTNYAGIIFQDFYDEKIDSEYDVCYTPNFVKKIFIIIYFISIRMFYILRYFLINFFLLISITTQPTGFLVSTP